MAHTSEHIRTHYPVPVFNFTVSIEGIEGQIAFSSVSGLSSSYQKIEYRDGMRGLFQMPGMISLPEVTLTRGVFRGHCQLYQWFNSVSFNEVDKKDVLINLTDPSGEGLILSWTLVNAFPTAINAPDLNASSNETATMTVTLAGDRLAVNCHPA